MFRLAHISDLHLGPLPPLVRRELNLKQRLGYLNWRKNRAGTFDDAVLSAVIADMRAAAPDHIAVTGDLINLGLSLEVTKASQWLRELGPPSGVTVIPGNHDAYVPAAVGAYISAWRSYFQEHAGEEPFKFPTLRRHGPVAIIGLSTAVPTAPLMATGRIGREQLDALGPILSETGKEGLCRVILIHHPPDRRSSPWAKRLVDAAEFRAVVARHGSELILHGHNHCNRQAHLPGPQAQIPVIGVAATAMRSPRGQAGGSWNLLTIEGKGKGFKIELTTRGWMASGVIETLSQTTLAE
jgi:3',5'-cyclic AMP phosphodiesterase CpdA